MIRKLNNRGFAFSTMLYGTLAMLTLTLYLILDMSKTSYDETYYYGDQIRIVLNKCTNAEMQLEKCYSSGNLNCSRARYNTCLGISDDTTTASGIIISASLKGASDGNVVTSGDGLYKDSYEADRYYYRGMNVNNYINYLGKKWRIISIEEDGTLRLLDYENPIEEKWHSGGNGGLLWEGSALYKYLNNTYFATLSQAPGSGVWKSTVIFKSQGTGGNFSLTDLTRLKNNQSNSITSYASVGILSVDDYIKATTNAACQTNAIGTDNCTSWLSQYDSWTINIDGETSQLQNDGTVGGFTSGNVTTSFAYYYDKVDAKIISYPCGETHTVYPVVYLNRNSVIQGGNGTESNPYTLK